MTQLCLSFSSETPSTAISSSKTTGDIDEFIPTDELDPNFLSESKNKGKRGWFKRGPKSEAKPVQPTQPLSSSDEERWEMFSFLITLNDPMNAQGFC